MSLKGLEQGSDELERLEYPVGLDKITDLAKDVFRFFVADDLDQGIVQLAESAHDLARFLRVDQERLHDEVELAHRRRGLRHLEDMALQEEARFVQKTQRHLLTDGEDGAIDKDALAGLEGESAFWLSFQTLLDHGIDIDQRFKILCSPKTMRPIPP